MIVYRLTRRPYADLSGNGARMVGGRYNPPGVPAVYASASIALAALEVLVHIDKAEVPNDYVVMAIRFNASRIPTVNKLGLGSTAVSAYRSAYYSHAAIRVASVIVPREWNYVLLPEARGFAATVEWIEPFSFDTRLF